VKELPANLTDVFKSVNHKKCTLGEFSGIWRRVFTRTRFC